MAKTWQQVVKKIGDFIDQCFDKNDGTLLCERCPAYEFCVSGDGIEYTTCANVLEKWGKKETRND